MFHVKQRQPQGRIVSRETLKEIKNIIDERPPVVL